MAANQRKGVADWSQLNGSAGDGTGGGPTNTEIKWKTVGITIFQSKVEPKDHGKGVLVLHYLYESDRTRRKALPTQDERSIAEMLSHIMKPFPALAQAVFVTDQSRVSQKNTFSSVQAHQLTCGSPPGQ